MKDDFHEWVEMMTQRPRFLVVEDDPQFAEMLAKAAEKRHLELTFVDRVDSAVEELKKNAFKLVLLDSRLQGKPGIELLRHIKAVALKIPVVFLSGFITTDMVEEARRLGMVAFVAKPNEDPLGQLGALFELLGIKDQINA